MTCWVESGEDNRSQVPVPQPCGLLRRECRCPARDCVKDREENLIQQEGTVPSLPLRLHQRTRAGSDELTLQPEAPAQPPPSAVSPGIKSTSQKLFFNGNFLFQRSKTKQHKQTKLRETGGSFHSSHSIAPCHTDTGSPTPDTDSFLEGIGNLLKVTLLLHPPQNKPTQTKATID